MMKFLIKKRFMFTEKKTRSRGTQNVSRVQILSTGTTKLAIASPVTADKCRTHS
jgi:hypothetical protein